MDEPEPAVPHVTMRLSVRGLQMAHLLAVGALFWLAMQVVHELGHVFGAWITGAEVRQVVLHPFRISETLLGRNPMPAVVALSGPLIGLLLPAVFHAVARAVRFPGLYLLRAFAGFCLLANGAYLLFGPSTGPSDTGVVISAGAPRWVLRLGGSLCMAAGIYLWHGLGRYFGMGEAQGRVRMAGLLTALFLLVSLAGLELLLYR